MRPFKNISTAIFLSICICSCSAPSRLKELDIAQVALDPSVASVDYTVGLPLELSTGVLEYSSAMKGFDQNISMPSGEVIGGIRVLIIPSSRRISHEFSMQSHVESQEGVIPYEFPVIGDMFSIFGTDHSIILVFSRCEALTILHQDRRGNDASDAESLWSLANILNKKIEAEVCGPW